MLPKQLTCFSPRIRRPLSHAQPSCPLPPSWKVLSWLHSTTLSFCFPSVFLYLLSWVFSSPQTLSVPQTWFWARTFYFSVFSPTSAANSIYMLTALKLISPPQNLVPKLRACLSDWPPETADWMASRDLTLCTSKGSARPPPELFTPRPLQFSKGNDSSLCGSPQISGNVLDASLAFTSTSNPLASPVILLPKFISSPSAWSHVHLHAPGHTCSHLGSCNSCLSSLPIFMVSASA